MVSESTRDPLRIIPELIRAHGDVARIRFFWVDYHVVNHPEGVHRVLVENHKNYVKSRNYAGLKVLLGQGLLTAEGEHWRRARKLAQPAFHRERLQGFAETMVRSTDQMLERWSAEGATVRDVHAEMMRLTLRIVGLTLFGADLDGDAHEVGRALTVALTWANRHAESLIRVPPWVPSISNLRFRSAKRTIVEVVERVITERRARGVDGTDLLGMLMSARDESDGQGMTDQQLLDEVLTLVLAGHETTANALSFALHLLARHPEQQRALEDHVDATLGDRVPTLADLPALDPVRMVAEESMRLFPPAWVIERDALEEDVVLGYAVPKGATVGLFPYLLHRHPHYWHEPERFDPSRFEKAAVDARPRHVYFPFGGGPRFCIGNAFAMMELQLLLAMIVQRFHVAPVPGFELKLEPSITLRPAEGMPLELQPRRERRPTRTSAAR
ncbi:cytochrome P450 [Myxococcota bacterium]|nr:cytochrome P450 [Myxococcota bacterium]